MKNVLFLSAALALAACASQKPARTADALSVGSISNEAVASGVDECEVFQNRIAGGMARPQYEVADETGTYGPVRVIWVHRPDPALVELAQRCIARGYK